MPWRRSISLALKLQTKRPEDRALGCSYQRARHEITAEALTSQAFHKFQYECLCIHRHFSTYLFGHILVFHPESLANFSFCMLPFLELINYSYIHLRCFWESNAMQGKIYVHSYDKRSKSNKVAMLISLIRLIVVVSLYLFIRSISFVLYHPFIAMTKDQNQINLLWLSVS